MPGEQNASTSSGSKVLRRHIQVLAAAVFHHAGLCHRSDLLRVPPHNESTRLKCSNRLDLHLPSRQETRDLAVSALHAASRWLVSSHLQFDCASVDRHTARDGSRIGADRLHLSGWCPCWISRDVNIRLESLSRRFKRWCLRSIGSPSRKHYAELQQHGIWDRETVCNFAIW